MKVLRSTHLLQKWLLSRSNLQRKLKGVTGLPPIDYIRLVRLKSAAQFLKEGKYRGMKFVIW